MQPSIFELANAIPLLKTLGITLVEVEDAHAVVEVTVAERHANYMAGAHGGLIATLIDTASFFPRPLLPSGRKATTVSLNVNYVRPAAIGERLRARSELLHLGKRTASLSVKITSEEGKLVAHGTATLMLLG